MVIPVSAPKFHFKFWWRRQATSRWTAKTVMAKNPQDAVEALQYHLEHRHSLSPSEVEVDHFFYRRDGYAEAEQGTLLKLQTPFPVVYCNKVWQPGSYPEYPAANRPVFN